VDEVLRQVAGIFADEATEHAQRITSALLAMEADPSSAPLHVEELYRQAHSLKGSASSLGFTELEALAHQLESMLLPVRRGQKPLTSSLVDASLRAMDTVRLRAEGVRLGTSEGAAETEAATREMAALTEEVEKGAEPPSLPEPGELVAEARRPSAEGDAETVRVAAAQLQALERRLDELRATRGRLEHRAQTATRLLRSAEAMWQRSRVESRQLAAGPRVGGDTEALRPDRETLHRLVDELAALRRDLLDDAESSAANGADFEENLRALRMVPAMYLLSPLQRTVRDACRQSNKDALCELAGAEVQVDRRLLEELKNPLIHLVRNAVDHGIEAVAVREAVGKPARGCVHVAIEQRGADIWAEVHDDGRGIDLARVRARAVERGVLDDRSAAALSEGEVHELLFHHGFSTNVEVTELSGRGVGLDVVREAIYRLHGRIEVKSEIGRGSTFSLVVPLTVAAKETMIVEEGGRQFAVPLSSIERIVRAKRSELRVMGEQTFFQLDDDPVAVVSLARVLGSTEWLDEATFRTLAVVRSGAARAAVICHRLVGAEHLILRPLPRDLQRMRLISAAAILSNGQPILVLSPRALVDAAHAQAPRVTNWSDGEEMPSLGTGTILVADDSITMRSFLRNILEASGYRVRTAADGDEALRLAFTERFDLVVSDVRMPRIDGLTLVRRIRGSERTRDLPVVLFSSLDSDEDRTRGMASGANVYLTKGAFQRGQLLEAVTHLLRRRA
jgi:two-component system, chemotaxis family, sensor kinase CheA